MTHDNIDIEFQPEPDRLYAHNRRQLSAMLDGELSPDQARFMLRRLQHDAELAACWERWQVCGDVLRGGGHALLPADFSKRVAAAITAPEGAARAAPATRMAAADTRRPHGLLRWGGGALAASVALVAMFMARQMPETPPVQLAEAAGASRQAEAVVDASPGVAMAEDTGPIAVAPAEVPANPSPASAGSAVALLAGAAPAVIAAADVPRRSGERAGTRSQAQRAALRRNQGVQSQAATAVASAPRIGPAPATSPAVQASAGDAMSVAADANLPALASLPAAATQEGEALFGGPAATARPWPRAVLPGLSRSQPFAAGYGLPQADAFAPFHPRLDDRRTPPSRLVRPTSQDVPAEPPAATPRPPGAR